MPKPTSLILCFLSLLALGGCEDQPLSRNDLAMPLDGSVADSAVAHSPTTIDLKAFRDHAIDKLKAEGVSDFSDASIWFVDGAGAMDVPPVYDYARLYFIVSVPGTLSPTVEHKLAYYVALQGYDETVWVKPGSDSMYVAPFGGVATFSADTQPSELDNVRASLSGAYPTATFEVLPNLGIITFKDPSPATSTKIFNDLKLLNSKVLAVEDTGEVYRVEFAFAKPISLGDGKTSQLVDLLSLTTITKDLRNASTAFTTEPHLPAPF